MSRTDVDAVWTWTEPLADQYQAARQPEPPDAYDRCVECAGLMRLERPGGNLPAYWVHLVPTKGHRARL